MAEVRIVNASPLIALAGIGLHEVLTSLGGRMVIPDAVLREVSVGDSTDPARRLIESGWGERAADPAISASIHSWGLGAGESSVIALGLAVSATEVILDDAPARRCARSLGLNVRGTLGVLILAKQRGLILTVKNCLQDLKGNGFYVDDALLDTALRLAGEL